MLERTRSASAPTLSRDKSVMSSRSMRAAAPATKQKRKRFAYDSNLTFATAYPLHEHIGKSSLNIRLDGATSTDTESLSKRVKDHAYRRIQLFYYLLVLYYNENRAVKVGKTQLQYGVATCKHCSAAHSSILPQVKEKLSGKTPLLNPKMHLNKSLNSTIELPKLINEYDNKIVEKNFRPVALDILNKCSMGSLNPLAAVTEFTNRLSRFQKTCLGVFDAQIGIVKEVTALQKKIKKLENTFNEADCSNKRLSEYIKTVAAINFLKDKWEQTYKSYSVSVSWNPVIECRTAVFEELLEELDKVQLFSRFQGEPKKIRRYAEKVRNYFKENPTCQEALEPLKQALICGTNEQILSALKEFCAHSKSVDLLFIDNDQVISRLYQSVYDAICLDDKWQPSTFDSVIKHLEDARMINEWQRAGTVALPSFIT